MGEGRRNRRRSQHRVQRTKTGRSPTVDGAGTAVTAAPAAKASTSVPQALAGGAETAARQPTPSVATHREGAGESEDEAASPPTRPRYKRRPAAKTVPGDQPRPPTVLREPETAAQAEAPASSFPRTAADTRASALPLPATEAPAAPPPLRAEWQSAVTAERAGTPTRNRGQWWQRWQRIGRSRIASGGRRRRWDSPEQARAAPRHPWRHRFRDRTTRPDRGNRPGRRPRLVNSCVRPP